ncbi:MAG: peptide/nickel transport system permease protein, partial [Bradyrhizobium sp.]|nr:peptide/nickel transport system permease protein [Bradyrhizobium sp.]
MDGSTLASPSAEVVTPQRPAQRFSPWLDAWRRFRRHRLAFASGIVLLAMILAIALGPFVWKVAINDIDFSARMQTPSWKHPFGTDDLGQDLLAR